MRLDARFAMTLGLSKRCDPDQDSSQHAAQVHEVDHPRGESDRNVEDCGEAERQDAGVAQGTVRAKVDDDISPIRAEQPEDGRRSAHGQRPGQEEGRKYGAEEA